MQEIVLVRHAAAAGQEAGARLSVEGRRQASMLADFLLDLDVQRVICSPFVRAIESAEPFCERTGIRMETEQRLAERVLSARNLPDWQAHLRRSFDDLDYRLEDGESSRIAQERGSSVVREALVTGERCVLITHGNLLALILKWADATVGFDFWSRLSNPDAFVLRVDGEEPRGFSRTWNPAS